MVCVLVLVVVVTILACVCGVGSRRSHVVACRASWCVVLQVGAGLECEVFVYYGIVCVSCRGTHRALALLGMLALGYPLLPR